MKQYLLLVSAILVSTLGMAEASKVTLDKALNSALKVQTFIHPKQNQKDIAIVYGGADISHRPFASKITVA